MYTHVDYIDICFHVHCAYLYLTPGSQQRPQPSNRSHCCMRGLPFREADSATQRKLPLPDQRPLGWLALPAQNSSKCSETANNPQLVPRGIYPHLLRKKQRLLAADYFSVRYLDLEPWLRSALHNMGGDQTAIRTGLIFVLVCDCLQVRLLETPCKAMQLESFDVYHWWGTNCWYNIEYDQGGCSCCILADMFAGCSYAGKGHVGIDTKMIL